MPDNILRSGVPHAVETNLVTRHAINPRHQFQDTDPQGAERASEAGQAADQVGHPHGPDQAPVLPAAHWQDNIQSLGRTQLQDNHQLLDQDQLQDNVQALSNAAMHDNRQSLGPAKGIEEKKLYLEKKSIRDNRQKIAPTLVERAAPQWSAPSDTEPRSSNRGTAAGASTASPARASSAAAALAHDDALRARMEKLKATVRNVNDSLSDLDDKP